MSDDKTVAIVIATYNGANYVREQLDSILLQSYKNFRVYISDDGSTDGTIQIVTGIKDERIIYLGKNPIPGVVRNFNAGLMSTVEDVIFLSDQDDIWPRDRLEKMMQFYKEKHSDNQPFLTYTDMTLVDSLGRIIDSSLYENIVVNPKYNQELHYLTWRCTAYGCTMMFNRDLLNIALPLPDDEITTMHDNWLILCAALKGKVCYYNYQSLFYRQHESNHTGGGKKNLLHKIKNFKKQVSVINTTQEKRIYQLLELQKRGILQEKAICFPVSIFKYFFDFIFIYKEERRLYVAFYCLLLMFTNRYKMLISNKNMF